jgi:hypothetical protein
MDKSWNECMSMQLLHETAANFGGRYARRKYGEAKDDAPKKKTKLISVTRKV